MNSSGVLSTDPYPLKRSRKLSSSNGHCHSDLKIPFSTERNQSLRKWLIPGLGQEMYRMSVEAYQIK